MFNYVSQSHIGNTGGQFGKNKVKFKEKHLWQSSFLVIVQANNQQQLFKEKGSIAGFFCVLRIITQQLFNETPINHCFCELQQQLEKHYIFASVNLRQQNDISSLRYFLQHQACFKHVIFDQIIVSCKVTLVRFCIRNGKQRLSY